MQLSDLCPIVDLDLSSHLGNFFLKGNVLLDFIIQFFSYNVYIISQNTISRGFLLFMILVSNLADNIIQTLVQFFEIFSETIILLLLLVNYFEPGL